MTTYLTDRLPIWGVADDRIISKTGAITLAYAFIKPEIFTLSVEEYNLLTRIYVKAFSVLPVDTIVVIQDWHWQTRWQGNFEKPAAFLEQCSERYHHGRPWMDHRCYLYITKRPAKQAVGAGKALLQKNIVPQDTLSPAAVQEFETAVSQFIQILTDSGLLQCRRLRTDELASSPGKTGQIERYCQLIMPGEAPELRDVHLREQIRIGNNHCLLHTLADAEHLPAQCSPAVNYTPYATERTYFPISFPSPVGVLLPYNHIYQQYFFITDETKTRKKLERKRRRMQSLSAHSRENALGKEVVDAFLDEAVGHGKKMIKAHFNIFSWTDDKAQLPHLREKVGGAIAKTGANPHLETVAAAKIWIAGIPGNSPYMSIDETFDMLLEQAVCFIGSETNYRDGTRAVRLRLGDRLSGRPLHVDLSDEPMRKGQIVNLNKFVLGPSGSGKSFFINFLLRYYSLLGAHALLLDIGHSYWGLCKMLGGYYFTYTPSSPFRLNPFWIQPGEMPDTEKRESLKALVLALLKKEDEAFLRSEYVALSIAIQLYYEKWEKTPELFLCFDSFYEFLRDEFTLILAQDKVKTKDCDIDNWLYVLRPFYKGGEYDFLLNAREQLDLLHQPFIVFELDAIQHHPILFPVVAIVIMEAFISKMRKLPGVRKVILIEEAWKAIARQGMSEYIKYLFKTIRKFNGEAIISTQDIEDIISSAVVKNTILNNADCRILLDQSKYRNKFDDVQNLLGLTEKDKALVLSLNQHNDPQRKYKEVFISLGAGCSKVYRTELSLEEYLTYTTAEPEKLQVQQWADQHGSLQKGIAALAAAIRDGSVKWVLTALMIGCSLLTPTQKAQAQFPIAEIVQMAVKKVIVATDLAIQRLQTQTIALQHAQKTLENAMQLDRLTDIADWARHQKDLFAGYYQELWQIRNTIALYQRVRGIVEQQTQLVTAYKRAMALTRQDPHFSAEELAHMARVYDNILQQSIRDAGALTTVITAFVTQMEDGDRLEIIDQLGEQMDRHRRDLFAFTQENILLSLQRSKSSQEINFVRALYNIH